MVGNILENNAVTISGKIATGLEFSHEVYGEGFYTFYVEVPRLSDSYDKISVTVSERLVSKQELSMGRVIEVEGQFRSYNNYGSDSNKLVLTVFAREVKFLENEECIKNPNQIFLNGFICKRPIYRTTPFGREITDMLLAVNRAYNKSDYIPCIAWGRNARFSQDFQVGSNVKIWGRIQSRQYQKRLDNGEIINKTAYEISVSKMELVGAQRDGFDMEDDSINVDQSAATKEE